MPPTALCAHSPYTYAISRSLFTGNPGSCTETRFPFTLHRSPYASSSHVNHGTLDKARVRRVETNKIAHP